MSPSKWVVAHRGDHSRAPENTLKAFANAAKAGADMVEFDVRQLADGTLVVFHDAEIAGQPLGQLTFKEMHEAVMLAGLDVPTLAQTLALCSGRVAVDIELKDSGCGDAVLEALFAARYGLGDVILTSFASDALERVHVERPGIRTGLLVDRMTMADAISQAQRIDVDYLAPDIGMVDNAAMRLSAESQIRLLPWTVNDRQDLQRLLNENTVAGVITDKPRVALGLRRMIRSR